MPGRPQIEATLEQRDELRGLAGSSDREEADRARAILLSLEGWTSERIALAFCVQPDSVRHWRWLSGGAEYVYGTASGNILNSGGAERIYGTASGDTVESGGRQVVSAGGLASGATVQADGAQIVMSGGLASGTVLSGSESVSAGGTAIGATINGGLVEVAIAFASGGTLRLDASTGFSGMIAGFAGTSPDRLDLRDIGFGPETTTIESFTEAAGNTSGTLTVGDGTHSANLTLLGVYATANFTLAGDGHGGTLVTDPPAASGSAQTNFADIAPEGVPSGVARSGTPSLYPAAGAAGADYAYGAGGSLLPLAGGADPSFLLTVLR